MVDRTAPGTAAVTDPFTEIVAHHSGRSYRAQRRVRLGDVTPDGDVRLDAVARYLHDVAADDVRDAGIAEDAAWVVRRTTLLAPVRPRYQEPVEVVTWCSGTGAAWAERRTTIRGGSAPPVEASSLWVCMDPTALRPKALDDRFFDIYGQSARKRSVRSRLLLPAQPPPDARTATWPLRRADFDVLGHVNNAVALAGVEEEVERVAPEATVVAVEVEYRQAIEDREPLSVASAGQGSVLGVWLTTSSGSVAVAAAVRLERRA